MRYKSKIQICLFVLNSERFISVIIVIIKLLAGLILPLTAYAFQTLIDEIIFTFQNDKTGITFVTPLLMIVGIYIFQAVEEPIESYCYFLLRQRLSYWFDIKNINKMTKIKYVHFENSTDLDLINRIDGSVGNAAVDLFDNVLNLISGIIKIIGTFILLLSYNFIISITVLVVAVPILLISAKYGKAIHEWYEKNSKSRRRVSYLSSIFIDRATSLEIKEYNHYDYLNAEWRKQFKELRLNDFKLQIKAWRNTIISGFLLNLFEYITYFIILLPAFADIITIGTFVGLSKAISSIESLILWKFSSLFSFFSRSTEYWKDYNRFLALSEVQTITQSVNIPKDDFTIEFRNVFFRYENMETDVLAGVSFKIQSQELCGLVGSNGAGKSTLSKLMLGLYEPTSGEILINGRNTKQMSFAEQVSYFGVTYQDFSRYNISVLDNIVLAEQNIDIVRVKKILQSLGVDYEKLPLGLNTIVGRFFGNGVDVSGGEWQKIAIARMLFSDAPCYIMDEPTASLDPMSEIELYKQIKTTLSGKPSLFITHRLGATVFCDKIMVLDGGKIVESGSFSELIERRGVYARMYKEQKQWYVK